MLTVQQRRAGRLIEDAIGRDDWEKARTLIREWLRKTPDDHWLLARLSLTYYEQQKYRTALKYALRAVQAAPYCPLATWDYAGALEMTGDEDKAILLYRRLIRRGESDLAFRECGEGIQSARSLIADCYFRIGVILEHRGERSKALANFRKHLARRGRGTRSIYDMSDVRRRIKTLSSR